VSAPSGQVGPYQIVGQLGAGGMGEVYLARDTRLERDVALKMLPREFSRDAERLGRFRREALALASLNHPNIATIYGFETLEGGAMALVLERVEGETLGDRILRGALPVEDALQVCAQIAEALEVAHERGVIHRDLKPGNVMLAPRGLVKVLDFGLAKSARDPEGAEERPQTTRDSAGLAPGDALARASDGSPLTEVGDATGTPGYMSPEQALGSPQDQRTDVFAFGCVLYECLSGLRAFDGASGFEIMAALLYQNPDFEKLPAKTPPAIRELLLTCLEKDPERRLREIRSARLVIEEALGVRRASALRMGEAAVATPNNLPRSLTSFVGRESEQAACATLFETTRLLTLSGVGGCGKTRLAFRLAEAQLDAYPDGVWFVDLAPLTDPGRVSDAVAAAMSVREEPGKSMAQAVAEAIGTRRVLLLLDNCEHLIAACAELVAHLLQSCTELKFIATSREGLGIDGERLHAVPTLSLPARTVSDPAVISGFESVRLFVERAVQVQPNFALGTANAAVIADICRRLDGIPLAIELAAARVKVLAVEQIQAKLDDRFRLLTGGSRAALPRHQTLRATIQWSVDQLAEEERELLRRLSVFAGGWTLDDAAAVCDENGDEFEVLDRLTRLVDKSLVVVDRDDEGTPRYRFLESVRQFALEMFNSSGDAPDVRERHLRVFLALAEESEKHLTGATQGEWFPRLAVEQENLLAALAWCPQATDGAERGLRLAGSVWRFWSARGHYELGLRALEDALHIPGAARNSPARALALVRAGGLALYRGDYNAARPWIEESLVLSREMNDRKGVARSLSGLGVVATYQNDYPAARAFTEEGLALYRELGEKRGMAVSLYNLGFLALHQKETGDALQYFEQALPLFGESGDKVYIALTLGAMATVSTRLGRLEPAAAQFATALALARDLEARREALLAIEGTAELAMARDEAGRSARIIGASQALREALGSPASPSEEEQHRDLGARVEARLGPDAHAKAMAEGRALTFEAVVAEILGWLESSGTGASAGGS
jgi:predicted ATPase